MNEQRENREVQSIHDRCLCHQVLDHLGDYLGISPTVRQHLVNSRIEFLKALRGVIDQRIEHLSKKDVPGTKIAVE